VIPIAQNVTYPPSAVTFSDPNLTASRFIQQPTFVARALQDFSQLRFVGAQLLKGRQILKGGSLLYELVAGIFADSTAEAVAPGSAYTRGTVSLGAAALVKAQKQGKDYPIEDETLARSNYDALSRVFRMAVNSAEQLVDQTIMAAILSAVTTTQGATAKWDRSGTTPQPDLFGPVRGARRPGGHQRSDREPSRWCQHCRVRPGLQHVGVHRQGRPRGRLPVRW
jgi:hypothetical protein